MNHLVSRHIHTLVACCGLAVGGVSQAQTQSWAIPGSGLASTAANWSPVGVPTATSDLIWNQASNYTVTFNATVPTSRSHTFRRGSVGLTLTSPHAATQGVTIGDLAGDDAEVFLTGSLTSGPGGFAIIGDAAGSIGELFIAGLGQTFHALGTGDLFVGNNGTGTLSIVSNAVVRVDDVMNVGHGVSGVGSLIVSGADTFPPFNRATLIVSGTGQSRWGNAGDATVTINNGALVQLAGSLVVANTANSVSNVSVSVASSSLEIAGDLMLGSNTAGGVAAGAASLLCNAGITVGGTTFIAGDPEGGTALFTSGPSGSLTTRDLTIGVGATFDLADGQVTVDGGVLVNDTRNVLEVEGSPGRGDLKMINGATTALPEFGGVSARIGAGAGANRADLVIQSRSEFVAAGDVVLGVGSDDLGQLFVQGAGTSMRLRREGSLVLGDAGDFFGTIRTGAAVEAGTLFLAASPGSNATVQIDGTSTRCVFGSIAVGGGLRTPGGAGTLDLFGFAAVEVTPAGGNVLIHPGGTVSLDRAILFAPDCAGIASGLIALGNASTLTLGTLSLESGGALTCDEDLAGSSVVTASTRLQAGSTLHLIDGEFIVGNAAAADGFSAEPGSVITIGNNDLTLHDADAARLHSALLDLGALRAPNGLELSPGGSISGRGSVFAPTIRLSDATATLAATGTLGLSYLGRVVGDGVALQGTIHRFSGPAGGFTGSGSIQTEVIFGSGAAVNATGDIALGNGSAAGVRFNTGSELHASDFTVTLLDSDGVSLGSITDMDHAGRVVCGGPLTVPFGMRLSGRGIVESPGLTINGTLAPGELVGEPLGETGLLSLNGSLTLSPGSRLRIQIGGTSTSVDADRVSVQGAAALSGDLFVTMIRGHAIPPGDSAVILDAAAVIGTFDTLDLPPAHVLDVGPTSVAVRHCVSDFNADGFIDFFDYDDYVACYEGAGCPPGSTADTNRDGFTDFFDYDDFVVAFENGC
jgi:T5SS/PEP-CTERM-associated repeat protein